VGPSNIYSTKIPPLAEPKINHQNRGGGEATAGLCQCRRVTTWTAPSMNQGQYNTHGITPDLPRTNYREELALRYIDINGCLVSLWDLKHVHKGKKGAPTEQLKRVDLGSFPRTSGRNDQTTVNRRNTHRSGGTGHELYSLRRNFHTLVRILGETGKKELNQASWCLEKARNPYRREKDCLDNVHTTQKKKNQTTKAHNRWGKEKISMLSERVDVSWGSA